MESGTKYSYRTISEYIDAQPEEIREKLIKIRVCILNSAPGASEKISWGMATFTLEGKNLVHIAAQKKHIGFYPGAEAVIYFKERTDKYKTSKGAVQFPYNKPIPFELIADTVKFRVSIISRP